jgi:hypothetical protein
MCFLQVLVSIKIILKVFQIKWLSILNISFLLFVYHLFCLFLKFQIVLLDYSLVGHFTIVYFLFINDVFLLEVNLRLEEITIDVFNESSVIVAVLTRVITNVQSIVDSIYVCFKFFEFFHHFLLLWISASITLLVAFNF